MTSLNIQDYTNVTHIRSAVTSMKRQPKVSCAPCKFVPFKGFDGQYLAGTGALVFEGELLQSVG